MAKNRCNYCGKELLNESEYCSDKCRVNYDHDVKRDTKNIKYFISGIVLGIVILFTGVLLSNERVLGISIMILGAVVVLFPFTTPETIIILGYKRAKIVGRILGIVLETVGIWIAFF